MNKHILLLLIVIGVYLFYTCIYSKLFDSYQYVIVDTHGSLARIYHNKIKEFEKKMQTWYPLGNDQFKISHGNNYYTFFNRIGDPQMIVVTDNQNIIATGCAVLRKNPNDQWTWYLCDLKVNKSYRNQWIPYKILKNAYHLSNITNKAYGITMNDSSGSNKVVSLINKIPLVKFKVAGILYIYQVNANTMRSVQPLLEQYYLTVSYVSILGIKDLILESTGEPLKLLHVNYDIYGRSKYGNYTTTIIDNYEYMFCLFQNHPIKKILDNNNIVTNITATIIQSNMDDYQWDFIQTHEI